MADVKQNKIDTAAKFGGVPYGNLSQFTYRMATNSSGVIVASDQSSAVVQTDVVLLGRLPAGMTLQDAIALVSDVFTASATAKIGFQYVDGVDVAAVPEDDDFFFAAGLDLNALAKTRMSVTNAAIVLPKDAYLILTVAGADLAAAGILDVTVIGELMGQP
jgi:hypothetical protein